MNASKTFFVVNELVSLILIIDEYILPILAHI